MNDENLVPDVSLSTEDSPDAAETTATADTPRAERLTYLQQQEQRNTLSPDEYAELTRYYQEKDEEEVARLRPASEALQREAAQLEAENVTLRDLIARREALMARLERTLQETRAEQATINAEFAQLVGAGRDTDAVAR